MNSNDITLLLQALPYIRHHRGATFVVKCGGEIARDREALDGLALDIAMCFHLGIRLVLVHGGGPQASDLSRRLGHEPVKVEGRRITDEATLEVAKMVFAGQIKTDIMSAFQRHGLIPIGLGIDVLRAKRRPISEVTDAATGERRQVDFGFVGDIEEVNIAMLAHQFQGGFVPVISPLASDGNGGVLNINADTVAAYVAVSLKADKLVMLTDAPGLLTDYPNPSSLISHITIQGCEELLKSGKITGGMIPKVEMLVHAVRSGVRRVHILHGKTPHALLIELLTKNGTGTMITSSEEENRYLGE